MSTGPSISDVVALNIRRAREERRMTVRDLSVRLGEVGHPLVPSGVSKLEVPDAARRRRIDVDDLGALALALTTSPAFLLIPPDPGTVVAVTPEMTMTGYELSAWCRGVDLLWGRQGPGDRERWFDGAPAEVRRQRELDRRGHPAREAVKRVAAFVDSAVEDFDPEASYVGGAANRQANLAATLRREADRLQRHLHLLADELEHEEAHRLESQRDAPQHAASDDDAFARALLNVQGLTDERDRG